MSALMRNNLHGEQARRWHELHRDAPEAFTRLAEPIAQPTEWPVLAFLNAMREGKVAVYRIADEDRVACDVTANWISQLADRPLPSVNLATWTSDCTAARDFRDVYPQSKAFSLCAEPQLRGAILLPPEHLDNMDALDLGSVIAHEALHGAHARDADCGPAPYLRPLTAALEESAVGFCEQMARTAARTALESADGKTAQIPMRDAFENVADPAGDRLARWMYAILLVCPNMSTPDICATMSALAVAALKCDDDFAVADLLNRTSGQALTFEQWTELLEDDPS